MIDFELTDEQNALVDMVRRFTAEHVAPIAAECDREGSFPREVFRLAWELGLLHATCPSAYGGGGLSELDNVLIAEELAYGCSGIQAGLFGNGLAMTPIRLAGNEDQKRKYLGLLTSQPVMASLCVTESYAGSDVAALRMRCERHGADFVLNGQKAWVTNGSYAEYYVVFATEDPALRHKGIAAFIVDRDTPGVHPDHKEDKLGQRASDTTLVHFDEVSVPRANRLAPAGKGFALAMETFTQTRPAIAAAAAGLMRRALHESVAYAKQRVAFGVPIGQHQLVQGMLADMAIRLEATRLLCFKAARSLDRGVRNPSTSSIAKAFGADAAMQTATDAVQIFGGNGYSKEYPVEKLLRDAKVLQIYEGTSQIQRLVIARNLLA